MKKMKTWVSLAAAVVMAFSFSTAAFAEDPTPTPEETPTPTPTVAPVEPELEVLVKPYKLSYMEGEKFDPSGLVVDLGGNHIEWKADNAKFKFLPDINTALTHDMDTINVLYTEDGKEYLSKVGILVSKKTSEPTEYASGNAYITAYACTDKAGGELRTIKKNDVFNLVLRITDNALANYDDIDEGNVAARLSSTDFLYTGLGEVSQFDYGTAEGKPYCTYVLLFRDVVYNGNGNACNIDISYEDTTRPLNSISLNIGICDTAAARTPNLIVRDFSYGGEGINAGQPGTLTLSVFATSGTETLSDVLVNISLPKDVTLASGSQTAYLGAMAPESSRGTSFQILPAANYTGGVCDVDISITAIGSDSGSSVSGHTSVSVPVLQPERFEITNLETTDTIAVGEESFLSVTFVNKGKNSIDNLSASIRGEGLTNPGQSQFLGNIAAGTEGSADFDIGGLEPGLIQGTVVLTYEDARGNEKTLEKEFTVTVEEAYNYGYDEPIYDEPFDEPEPEKKLPIIPIAIGVGGIALIAAAVMFIRKRRKAAALNKLGDEDEDF